MEFQKVRRETALDYPEHLILYAKPKLGKTDLVSYLPDCGIVDIENGAKYVTGYIHKVHDPDPIKTLANLNTLLDWLIKEKPYTFIAYDTMTFLEECTIIQGTYDYMNSTQGKKFNRVDDDLIEAVSQRDPEMAAQLKAVKGAMIPHTSEYFKSVETLPEGYGYRWSREAFKRIFDRMKLAAPRIIFICHIKDKMIDSKAGTQVSGREIDLTGKLKSITTSFTDNIAYLNRGKDGNSYLSFQAGEAVAEGTRVGRLSGENILIGEWDKVNHTYSKTHWDTIYPDLKNFENL
jgi:hypothetical protein